MHWSREGGARPWQRRGWPEGAEGPESVPGLLLFTPPAFHRPEQSQMLPAPAESRHRLGALRAPALLPASPPCGGFVSGGQKVTVLRRLQRHLLQGRPRPPGSRGFPAGAAEGTAPADVPSTRLCSPQLRAPRVAPCPLPSQGSLGWQPAPSALPPRPSRCPRWLHWWVLVSYLPAFALSRVSAGASEADPVGGRGGREKTPLGGGRRRFAAAGSAEGVPVARTLRPPLHRAATQRSMCLAAGMGPRDAAAGAAPVLPGGDVVGARSARQDLPAGSGIQLGA